LNSRRQFVAAAAAALLVGGCRRSDETRKNNSKLHLHWLLAAVLLHRQRKGEYPQELAELKDLFREDTGDVRLDAARSSLSAINVTSFEAVLRNPRTGTNPGYLYEAPQSDISSEPVILQLQGETPLRNKSAAYLDGTVR